MTTVTHIPFAEFEHNPTNVFRRVTDEHITVVVEDETGKKMVLRPLSKVTPARHKTKKTKVDYAALKAAAGSWSDVDTDALEGKHFQPLDIGDDLVFFDHEVIGMIVIVDVVVHSLAFRHSFYSFIKGIPARGSGDSCFLPLRAACVLLFTHRF